jgi:energy-coupling factor transporter ATP-binding protein EcfA2
MITIKEIKINGIRGFNFLKDENENSLPHKIELNKKHLFLYGENGTGKSSFCDSIEWCLTGENEESSIRKIKNNKDFLMNKSCSSGDNPFVEILFEKNGEDYAFKRELKGKKSAFDFEDEAHCCIIEASRIENFVIDTKSSLWQRFSSLLGFDALISFVDKISRLEREANRAYTDIKKRYEEKNREIQQKKDILSQLEVKFSEEFGDYWPEIVNREDDQNDTTIYSLFKELDNNIKKYTDTYKSYLQFNEDILEKEKLLKIEKQKTTTFEISKIIQEANKYFEMIDKIDECPLCGNKIDFEYVRNNIKYLNESLYRVQSLESQIAQITKDKEFCDINLKSSRESIEVIYKSIYKTELDATISEDLFCRIIIKKFKDIESDLEKISKISQSKKQIMIYQERKKILMEDELFLKNFERDLNIKEKLFIDIQSFKKLYNIKYSELIKKELRDICDGEISAIYNAINRSNDEIVDKFIIEPNIESQEIEFSVQMKSNSQKVSALEILSTGHLRCLGFALLIARIKIKIKNLNFIVIDDPIYSIDHEHRYNLIQYLRELSNSYQLLITSSDRLFYDIIRNNFGSSLF